MSYVVHLSLETELNRDQAYHYYVEDQSVYIVTLRHLGQQDWEPEDALA